VYSPFNDQWDGCSNLLNLTNQTSILYDESSTPTHTHTLLTIIGPKTPFNLDESKHILTFLTSGGVVLLADDTGSGNSLLQSLNVSARFARTTISDLYFYSKQPIYPLISGFAPSPVTRSLTLILMDHPSYIQIMDNRTVNELAYSSPFTFIDNYGNGTISQKESTQSYPVMASTQIGNGLLVLVSNAAVFANGAIGFFNNTQLFRNLLNMAGGSATIDITHLNRAPLSDLRSIFRTDVETLVPPLRSTLVRTLTTAALVLVFSAAFIQRMRTSTRSTNPRSKS